MHARTMHMNFADLIVVGVVAAAARELRMCHVKSFETGRSC
jgi:hypothetical protein